MEELTYRFIRANDMNLHVAFAGPQDGNPVILLHGFPDASFGWAAQIRALADAGYSVIAPDQRGYNLSDKPRGRENYRMSLLVGDILPSPMRLTCRSSTWQVMISGRWSVGTWSAGTRNGSNGWRF